MTTPNAEKSVEPDVPTTAESEPSQAEPEARESDQNAAKSVMARAENVLRLPNVLLGLVGSLIGIVGGVVALYVVFFPSPPTSEATLGLVTFDPDTSRRAYLEQTDQGLIGFTTEQLARRGAFVRFRVKLDGLKGKSVTIKRELIDDATDEQLIDERSTIIRPPTNNEAGGWHDWVPLPKRAKARIVLELLAEGRTAPLDTLQTRPFSGLGSGESS